MATEDELRGQLKEAQDLLEEERNKVSEADGLRDELREERKKVGEADGLRDQLRELSLRLDESRKVTTYVEVQSERHLAKFSGEGSVAEWVQDATLALEDWTCSDKSKVRFLMNHMGGTARDEVRLRAEIDRDTPEKVFMILRAAFRSQKTTRQKLGEFFSRTQKQGESLHEFSLALLNLQGKAARAGERVADKLLCQQFVEGITDDGLSRELSRLLDREPQLSLTKLREQAIRWNRREKPSRGPAAVREAEAVGALVQASATQEPYWKKEMRELKEQVQQLTQLMAGRQGAGQPGSAGVGQQKKACFGCGSTDHMRRDCPNPRKIKCYGCGGEGHIRRNCPEQKDAGQSSGLVGNGFPPQSGAKL